MPSARPRAISVVVLVSMAGFLAGCPTDEQPAAPPITSLPTNGPEATDPPGPDRTEPDPGPIDGSLSGIAAACADDGVVVVDRSVGASSTDAELADGEGEGGTIHLIETSLTATAPDSAIQLLTSGGSGTLRLERSSIDMPGTPRLSGAECVAEVNDQQFDCMP